MNWGKGYIGVGVKHLEASDGEADVLKHVMGELRPEKSEFAG